MKKIILFCAIAVFQLAATVSPAANLELKMKVEKYQLPNGLTVILYADHSAPLISYNTWFRVGSRDEEPGYTGIAHLFEHLMFKGAKRYGPKELDKQIQGNGGANNAFTTHDYTGYFEVLPSDKLELAVDIESDRMENLAVTAENLKSEREVVKEERRFRVDNDLTGKLFEETFSTVFKVNPYHWPVIGWMDDIDRITLEKCQKFYKTYYAPNNAVVVIAGDFDKDHAKKLVEKYYGAIKAQPIPDRKYVAEPAQTEARQNIFEKEAQNEFVTLAYEGARAGHADYYALDILALVLGEGPSSRLYKKLVYETQLATGVGVYNSPNKDPGIFQILVSLKPGVSYQRVERIINNEIRKARTMPFTEAEIQKAKNIVMTSNIANLKTTQGKGQALAFNEVVMGSYEYLFTDLERYNKVNREQVQRAAENYLDTKKSNLIVLKPKVQP